MNARIAAAKVLIKVFDRGATLQEALPSALAKLKDSRDRALTQELCYGVMRWYFRLDLIAASLVHRRLQGSDTGIRALIFCGIYQLAWLRMPEHAAVAETVQAAKALCYDRNSGFINAVLRRYQRERGTIERSLEGIAVARFAYPEWLINSIRSEWPGCWENVLEAGNQRPPLHLRVNPRAVTREQCLKEIAAAGMAAQASTLTPGGIHLVNPVDVDELPGFKQGRLSVQDFGAQLAATLLDPQPEQRVLDACAAPGGKSADILERFPHIAELLAIDRGTKRLELVHATLARLHLHARILNADASSPDTWWDGRPFDRILLDAPCSATGVIRRHPDVKFLRKPGQLGRFAATQRRLLDSLWPLLRPGGRLLYATCSILCAENDGQIEKFLENHKDVRVVAINEPWGTATGFGRQTLPGLDDSDGFYYALLEKI